MSSPMQDYNHLYPLPSSLVFAIWLLRSSADKLDNVICFRLKNTYFRVQHINCVHGMHVRTHI